MNNYNVQFWLKWPLDHHSTSEATLLVYVKQGTDITDILPKIHGKGLAEHDRMLDELVTPYQSKGEILPGKTYQILSKDIAKTSEAMKQIQKNKNFIET